MNALELALYLECGRASELSVLGYLEEAAKELRRLAGVEADRDALKAKVETDLTWTIGHPTKSYYDEWFLAVLDDGSFVALKRLPDEYSYDFKTRDETYLKAFKIKKWRPKPDSQYLTPSEFYEKQIKELKEKINELNTYISGHGISEVAK